MGYAAIVLAAGEGKRLGGVCKATLTLGDGRTYLKAIAETARAAGCDRVVVVAGEPHLEETRREAEAVGAELALNPDPAKGMSSSIAVGVQALGGTPEAALLWPVDHAEVKPETVRAILDAARPDAIVVPTYLGHGGHPTAFGQTTFQELIEAVEHGGARHVLRRVPSRMHRVALVDPGLVKDHDEPEGEGGEGEAGG